MEKKAGTKLSKKTIAIGAAALAVVAAAIILIVVFTNKSKGGTATLADAAKEHASGKYDLYQLDADTSIENYFNSGINDFDEDQLKESKAEVKANKELVDKFANSIGMEFDQKNEGLYLVMGVSGLDYSFTEANDQSKNSGKIKWSEEDGKLVFTVITDEIKNGDWDWDYNPDIDDFERHYVPYDKPETSHNEKTGKVPYELDGKKLTITADGVPLTFTREGSGKSLEGEWTLDLKDALNTFGKLADEETASIINGIKLDEYEYIAVELNKDGTINVKAKIRLGTYKDGKVTVRDEIKNVLDQYNIPLEISYKIDGKKLEMTGSISMYGMKKALTIVFTKL